MVQRERGLAGPKGVLRVIGLRPSGKPLDQPPYPKMQGAPHFYPDRSWTPYTVTRTQLDAGTGTTVYHIHTGKVLVARAVLRFFQGCIDHVLVFRQADRRRGIASALYSLIEGELGRPLRPSRIRSKAGRAFWASGKAAY